MSRPAERHTSRVGVLRLLLLFEASTFVAAAAIHFGVLLESYGHRQAGTAESVIAVVLLAALALTWAPSPWPHRAAVGGQAFATLGVLVGLFTDRGRRRAADRTGHRLPRRHPCRPGRGPDDRASGWHAIAWSPTWLRWSGCSKAAGRS